MDDPILGLRADTFVQASITDHLNATVSSSLLSVDFLFSFKLFPFRRVLPSGI
jgi:hypothetical protein